MEEVTFVLVICLLVGFFYFFIFLFFYFFKDRTGEEKNPQC